MKYEIRIINRKTLEDICQKRDSSKYQGIIIGHENCPHFYRQSSVDGLIQMAKESNLTVKVNIPVVFENYLEEFQEEASRLIEDRDVKLIVNDWGMLYFLHRKYPKEKFSAGKGVSFTYGDNPWNEHILDEEKEKYKEILKAHNFENRDTMDILMENGVDEVELSDLKMSENAYETLKKSGFIVSVNQGMSVVTMSRACHCLRFLDKCGEMGNCIQYCNQRMRLSIDQYYDMMETKPKPISEETKKIQPDMIFHGNILLLENKECAQNYSFIDNLVYDERLSIGA